MNVLKRHKNSIFSLIFILSAVFVSCKNESDYSQDIKEDYTSNYTFYSDNPEATESFFTMNCSFEIGTKVYAEKDFPNNSTPDFNGRKTGYKINGWAYYKNPLNSSETLSSPLDSYIEFNPDGSVNNMLVVSLPASFYVNQWEPISYSVTFYGNGGTDSAGSSEQTQANFFYDEATPLNSNPFSRDSYCFSGWGTSENQNPLYPSYYNDSTVLNMTSKDGDTIKLYALWVMGNILISFDAGEGSGTMESITVSIGSSLPSLEDTVAALTPPAGKVFSGWTCEWQAPYGNSTYTKFFTPNQILDGENYPGKNITLVAQWQTPIYVVDFITNGGTYIEPQWIESGGTATEPAPPVKEGYTFEGWYTDFSLEEKFSFSTPITEEKHLVAKWIQEKASVEGKLPDNIAIEYTADSIIFRVVGEGTYSNFQWIFDGSTVQNSPDNSLTISYSDPAYMDHLTHTVFVGGIPADDVTDVITAGFKFRIN